MLPGCIVVRHHFVEIGHGDDILGKNFVVGHTRMLKPVAPQNLIWKVGSPDLDHDVRVFRLSEVLAEDKANSLHWDKKLLSAAHL